jgi:uncharacterized protein (UPF0212 family)
MDCRVVVEAAVPVYDVGSADEAVRIAISKTGEMLNPDLNYVEIDIGDRSCPHCGDELDPAFIAADEGLVALELEMTVFNVERDEHAARIARKEIGQRLENIPLEVLEVETVEADEADEADEDDTQDGEASGESAADAGGDGSAIEDELDLDVGLDDDDDDDILPEFEELVEE